MLEEKLSYSETARQFEINDYGIIQRWERIYLEEGSEGLAIERRGRKSTGRPMKLQKEVEEDLIAEVQRLRAENAYLKTCKPWFWKTSDSITENTGDSETKARIFTGNPAGCRSTASCNLLLSSKTTEESR